MDNIKKFEDFLDRMQGLLDNAKKQGHIIVRVEDLESTFPELRESEDEKIRKGIIDFLWKEKIFLQEAHSSVENNPKYRFVMDAIAWLEKQGEHTDKVEPKFQNGQWIVWQNKCYKVNDNGCGYELIDQNGLSTSLEYGTVDASARLWNITKDAKDGDVLYFNNDISGYHSIGLFKRLAPKNETYGGTYRCYARYGGFNEENRLVIAQNNIELCHCGTEACPATKFQRGTLLAKMKEEGYEWLEDTHELKKISQRMVSAEAKEALYDKPAWSEEDEKMLDAIIDFFENGTVKLQHDLSLYASWLKSLKQRHTWKPSEEQMSTLNLVVSDYYHACTKESDKKAIVLKSILEQLKQL